MVGKKESSAVPDMFRSKLEQILNLQHQLVQLAEEIDWKWIESELAVYYARKGRPSVPIRTMAGLILLKQMFDQSDETVIDRWLENPYWQYFTGEEYFQHDPPFDPSDFVHFRKRIGREGMEKVLALSVKLHGEAQCEDQVQIDTTVQEKNITYPTDVKLQSKIMEYLRLIADYTHIDLRQSYVRKQKEYVRQANSKNRKKSKRGRKKLKNICGRLLRDVERKLPDYLEDHYGPYLEQYRRVWSQKRTDKNKIYSLHEPEAYCISKGKAHKKYEFGCKVAVVRNSKSGVITAMKSFAKNIYDGHALAPVLEQCERIRKMIDGRRPTEAVVDRGCKGQQKIENTKISIPHRPPKDQTRYEKQKKRKKFRARAAIEPIIGHLKHDHRMLRNYLSGVVGDAVNALLAGAAFNLKKRLNQIKKDLKNIFISIFRAVRSFYIAPICGLLLNK